MKIHHYKDIKINKEIYMQTIYAIKSYAALKERAEELIYEKKHEEVQVKNKLPYSTVEKVAENREKIMTKIKAIDKAFNSIPAEYKNMLWANIAEDVPMKDIDCASEATLKRYRKRIIVEVAHNLELIDDLLYERIKHRT